MRPSSAAWAPSSRPRGPSPSCGAWTPTRARPSWRPICAPRPRSCWPGSRREAPPRSRASTTSTAATRPSRRSFSRWAPASRGPGNMPAPLMFALPKGRLLDPALQLLTAMGIKGLDVDTRRLLLSDESRDLRVIFLKPADIPTYVEYGAADLGIVGKDILAEQQPDVYEPLDLGFGFCRLVVAEPRALWERDDPSKWSWVRVATKYPRMTEAYFSDKGIQVEIVRLDGSIELAPLVGLAERIVDLVQTGETLRANGLVEVAEITRSTAHLIVNRASMKTAHGAVTGLIDELKGAVRAERRPSATGASGAR